MYYVFSVVGITVYSGISTVLNGLCDKYFIPYLIFLAAYTFSFVLAIRFSFKGMNGLIGVVDKSSNASLKKSLHSMDDSRFYIPDTILKVGLVLFFSYYFVQLTYPEFRLLDIFNLQNSIDDIFLKRERLRGNTVYQVFYYFNLMSIVPVFIYSYKKFRKGMWWIPIIIWGLWWYLQIVVLGYFSRNEMLVVLAFLVLIFDNRKRDEIEFSARLIVVGIIGLLMMIPFLNSYELTRMGVAAKKEGVLEALKDLMIKETTYGKYYDFCASYNDSFLVLKYIIWLLTLPLPSAIFGTIKSFGLETNTLFTVAYTGIRQGSPNYSVILPSIFGESLLIYGKNLYWIHPIFLGFFFGAFCKRLEKNRDFTLLNLYFAVTTFILGRGGSEAVIASMVNYMVIFFIISVFVRKPRRKVGLNQEKQQ